jgi:putative transposase
VRVLNKKHIDLTDENFRAALRQGIIACRQTLPFKIDGWVLLPDHLHCVWTLPEGDANYSARWAIIKRHVSKTCVSDTIINASRQKRGEAGIWQRRFWEHVIRDDADYIRHIDYIHYNPVKHGYVKRVADWRFSSFHRYVVCGVYLLDWCDDSLIRELDFE